MGIYGKEFAAIYNEKWAWFGPHMWPFLSRVVTRLSPEARSWLDLCCGAGSLLRLVADAGFSAMPAFLLRVAHTIHQG